MREKANKREVALRLPLRENKSKRSSTSTLVHLLQEAWLARLQVGEEVVSSSIGLLFTDEDDGYLIRCLFS